MAELFTNMDAEYSIGNEVGESGTPHLQGFVQFKNKMRPLESSALKAYKGHWEKMRGTRREAINYTQKDGDYVCSAACRPAREIQVLARSELYSWQEAVVAECETVPNDRKIKWFWESDGGTGKSALVRYLVKNHGALVCAGKAGDMKYSIVKVHEESGDWPELIIFDIPRTSMGYLSYSGMEEIKNGCFANTKYESSTVLMPHPHVICFANEEPDRAKMSADRWDVTHIAVPQSGFDTVPNSPVPDPSNYFGGITE